MENNKKYSDLLAQNKNNSYIRRIKIERSMKIEDIVFNPIGLGEPPYKFEEVIVTRPEANITGLCIINGKLYKKVYKV